jgi:hypothetical protein
MTGNALTFRIACKHEKNMQQPIRKFITKILTTGLIKIGTSVKHTSLLATLCALVGWLREFVKYVDRHRLMLTTMTMQRHWK